MLIDFAGLLAMALVGLTTYQWAMRATYRYFDLLVERGQIEPKPPVEVAVRSTTAFIVRSGRSVDRLRVLLRHSVEPTVESARRTAVARWVASPILIVATGVLTWVSLFAVYE